MKKQQREEEEELEVYYDDPFEAYDEPFEQNPKEEVRLTMRAPETDLQKVSNMYQQELKGELPDSSPSPLARKKEEPKSVPMKTRKENMIKHCKSVLGEQTYSEAYRMMKEMKEKEVPDLKIQEYLVKLYGKQNLSKFQQVEEIIYLEGLE